MAPHPRGGTLVPEESTRNIPPGWKPEIPRYSAREYQRNLSIWRRTTNEPDHSAAALLMLDRLQGGTRKQALHFAVERDGQTCVGRRAFAPLAAQANPGQIIQAEANGISQFTRWFGQEYGLHKRPKRPPTVHRGIRDGIRRGLRDGQPGDQRDRAIALIAFPARVIAAENR